MSAGSGSGGSDRSAGHDLTADDLLRLVDTAPVGHLLETDAGTIRWINTTLLGWLGYSEDQIVGQRTFQDLLAPGGRIYFETHVRPLLRMQSSVNEIAVELMRSDGSRLPVLFNATLRQEETRGEELVEVIVLDATARRSYELELLRQRQIAEQSEARLQLMYDVVSGLATTKTVDDVHRVLAEHGSRSFADATFNLWLFDDDHSASRVRPGAVSTEMGWTAVTFAQGGPALDELAAGRLVSISERDAARGSYPLICDWLTAMDRRSAIIAPLHIDGNLQGGISYGFQEGHDFDDAEQRAVASLAVETAQALHRARLLETERRSKDRLALLFQFTTLLSESVTLDDVIDVITEEGAKFVGALGVRVALLDETQKIVTFMRGQGLGGQLGIAVPIGAASIGCEATRTGVLVVTETRDELVERFPASPILSEPTFGRVISVPLRREDEVLGAWVLAFADPGPPHEDDLKVIRLFADQAGQAARRAALHEAESAARTLAERRRLVTQALNRASTTEEVGRALTSQGRGVFEADGLALFAVDPNDSASLLLAAHDGLGGVHSSLASISTQTPMVDAAFGRAEPLFVSGASEVGALLGDSVGTGSWTAAAILPLNLAGQPLGLLVIGFEHHHRVPTAPRVALSGLAAEVSVALGRIHRFDLEHAAAITLQRSLLPLTLPDAEGWATSSWYTPGSEHLVVGGDLYDLTVLDDGRLVVAVGDIVGHGINAAASMGQLRSAAKALALINPNPAQVIHGLHAFARVTPGVMSSTICCVALEPDGTGRCASAGHLFPIVLRTDGTTDMLEGGRSPLLGVGAAQPSEAEFSMEPGATLVLYTDGLIERRHEGIDEGLARLRQHLSGAAAAELPEARDIVAALLAGEAPRDDVAVVCLTRTSHGRIRDA